MFRYSSDCNRDGTELVEYGRAGAIEPVRCLLMQGADGNEGGHDGERERFFGCAQNDSKRFRVTNAVSEANARALWAPAHRRQLTEVRAGPRLRHRRSP